MLLCSPVAAADNQKQLETLRKSINALQMEMTAHERTKQNAADALQFTEQSISNLNRKLVELKINQQKIDDELKQVLKKHKQLHNELESERGQLSALLYQQYLGYEKNYFRALLNQNDPNQAARDMYYYRQLSRSSTENINNLHDKLNQLQELARIAHEKRDEIATIQTEHTQQKKKLSQEKLNHQAILARVSKAITQQQNEIDKLTQDEKRVARLIHEINQILKHDKSSTHYNTDLPDPAHRHAPFQTLKGKLSLPVRGKLTNRFGSQRSGKHITWKGLFIRSPQGDSVKAIASGRVVFADWLRGFGNLMIIDHSHDYLSLYGNNEALLKQVGDSVHSGDSIAIVGNSGGNPDSGLYFELRHKGKAFDPLTWIKIE
ncbi:MAG: peptidoglycan DD-metalloendopeptidase family protein [Nitrosomonas sp.]|nr:peptidoglycan DD-metalloendopeptidase family protein [Nitrosomonas sp.]